MSMSSPPEESGSACAAAPEPAATADAAPTLQSREKLEELEERLYSFLKEGESLAARSSTKSVALSYFRPFNSVENKTHLCLLCTVADNARVNLQSTSNAKKHMERYHQAVHSSGQPYQRPRSDYEISVATMLQRAAASASTVLGVEARTRQKQLAEKARAATKEQTDLVRHCVAKLCASRLLPYSAVEWPELRELVEVCCLLPAVKVRRESSMTVRKFSTTFPPYTYFPWYRFSSTSAPLSATGWTVHTTPSGGTWPPTLPKPFSRWAKAACSCSWMA